MKAHMILNWLLFNYLHHSIQNYIINEVNTAQLTFSLTKSDLISPQDKRFSFLEEMISHIHS
jgi:hypothetical protein